MNLCFADRERYYGDPRFVDVPMETLLSRAYAQERLKQIRQRPRLRRDAAARCTSTVTSRGHARRRRSPSASRDCRATPPMSASSTRRATRSPRRRATCPGKARSFPGSASARRRADRSRGAIPPIPPCAAPGKRPRLTPNPSMAMRKGEFLMPFGAPGGDLQPQGMLQVLRQSRRLRHGHPAGGRGAALRHPQLPGQFRAAHLLSRPPRLEQAIGKATGDALGAIGHR